MPPTTTAITSRTNSAFTYRICSVSVRGQPACHRASPTNEAQGSEGWQRVPFCSQVDAEPIRTRCYLRPCGSASRHAVLYTFPPTSFTLPPIPAAHRPSGFPVSVPLIALTEEVPWRRVRAIRVLIPQAGYVSLSAPPHWRGVSSPAFFACSYPLRVDCAPQHSRAPRSTARRVPVGSSHRSSYLVAGGAPFPCIPLET